MRKITDELFACIRPQLQVDRHSPIYTACHMWYHLYHYGKNSEKELSKQLECTLQKHNLDLSTYFAKMYYCTTWGFEITLLLLSRIYNVDIVFIRPDFVWLSRTVAPITCGIVLVQDASGNF